ncbi:ABC transporter permease [Treponema sp. OMZ 840]|uniref:ABC transporter permease n=1 Tax=Treponema sp. OMZ 840 TaxID=244313 RepID=UPI003D91D388
MKQNTFFRKLYAKEYFSLIVTFLLLFTVMALINGKKFISYNNITAMAYQMPMIALLAIGMMISELSGGINLSIVANANFNGIMLYVVLNKLTQGHMSDSNGIQIALAIAAGFAICVCIGFCNGLMIAKLKIPALLVTLGMMTLLQGFSLVITEGYTISGFPAALTFIGNGKILGIPTSLVLLALVILVSHFILNRTVFGKQLYMTGANNVAAKYSNIDVDKIIIWEYIFSATFAFFCCLVMIGQMNSVKANYYDSYLLIAVLASFLGGVDPAGGFGKLMGTVLASAILQVISTGFNLMRMDPFVVTATWGGIIIIVLFGKEITRKLFLKKA